MGAIGGMLITVDYFLTSAISSVCALPLHRLGLPFFSSHIDLMAGVGLGCSWAC